ncbi:50S ribosomal protein L25 [Blattabacterium cuenoti]|uniref:50S ribosomal protein L25 n=1 Tax=Blattabacterium cuenoti TaxID=1653831 RepID=UPI00163CD8BC|nr:50S ribosomal protein L25 [Blattabacterium cuenoti]
MKYINIYGEKRNIGKKQVYFTRIFGKIPCILYGNNINIPFSASLDDLKKIVYTSEVRGAIITLKGCNKKIKAIRKEIQFDPVKDKILHVDFYKIDESKPIILYTPLKSFGRPIGVSKGGIYYSPIRKLKIKAFPSNIPDYIKLNVNSLDIGDRITVKNLHNEKYSILHSDNTLVARVKFSRTIEKISQDEENKEKK